MSIVISLIINLIVVYAWIWFVNLVFKEKKLKIQITIKIFLIGFFLVFGLFFYKNLLDLAGFSNLYFLQEQTLQTVSIFIFFCDIIFLVLSLLFRNLAKKNIINIFVIINLLFFGIYFAGYGLGISLSVMYYFISSYAEEFLKYGASNNLFLMGKGDEKSSKSQTLSVEKQRNNSDLIFFCILIALGFSIVENVFYVGYSIYSGEQTSVISTFVSRGLVSTLIHIISTGLIGFIYLKLKSKTNVFLALVLGLMTGISIHGIYNLSLHFGLWYIVLFFVLIGYFVVSYLIYNSDVFYSKP